MIPLPRFLPIALLLLAGCPQKTADHKSAPPPDLAIPPVAMAALPPLPQTPALVPPASATQFTFVVAGDNRPKTKDNLKPEPTAQSIFNAAKALPAAFVFWTGDTILGKSPSSYSLINQEYVEFFQMAATAGVAVFNAPGNHEMDDANDVPNAQMQIWYQQIAKVPLYGAFSYGNARFIALDTEELHSSASDGGVWDAGVSRAQRPDVESDDDEGSDPGHVTQAQIAALTGDLALTNTDATIQHVFVFMHHPIVPLKSKDGLDPKEAAVLKALFAQYPKVHFVIAGHEHLYYNPLAPAFDPPSLSSPPNPKYPPPYYLVSGGAGAPNKSGPQYHYLVFAVNGAAVTVTKFPLK
jgi:hypothetical protein